MLLIMSLILFPMMTKTIIANEEKSEVNVESFEKAEGGWLITDEQMIKIANEFAKCKANGEEWKKKALMWKEKYEQEKQRQKYKTIQDNITGAGIGALLIMIANGVGD